MEAYSLGTGGERQRVLESLYRIFQLMLEMPNTDKICDVLKDEVSNYCSCDTLIYFNCSREFSRVDMVVCEKDSSPREISIPSDESSMDSIEEFKCDSILTFDSPEFAPNCMREIIEHHNLASGILYVGDSDDNSMHFLLVGSDKPSAGSDSPLEDISELLRVGLLVIKNLRRVTNLMGFSKGAESLFDLAPVSIIVCDSNGKVTGANKQAVSLFSHDNVESDLIGKDIISDEQCVKCGLSALLSQALAAEESEGENIKLKSGLGKACYMHVRFRSVQIMNEKKFVMGVMTDITPRIHMQQQLERSYQTLTEAFYELERVDKMKTQFIDVVSHEIRTPLTVIRGYLDMLDSLHRDEMGPMLSQKIDSIRLNTERLYELIEAMLDVTRIEKGAIEIVKQEASLNALIEEVVAMQKPLAEEKRQELQFVIVGNPKTVMIDRNKMRDALKNMIHNAIKYTPEGGNIQVGMADEGKMIHIWIRDNGVGISLSELNKIFERFYIVAAKDLSHQVNRIGLGLPIAKGIIESHGGKIWVESEIDKGTIFHINLPKA